LKGRIDILSSGDENVKSLEIQKEFSRNYRIFTDTNLVHIRFFGINSRSGNKIDKKLRETIALGYERDSFLSSSEAVKAKTFAPEFMIGTQNNNYPDYDLEAQANLVGSVDKKSSDSIRITTTINSEDFQSLLESCKRIPLNIIEDVGALKYYSRIILQHPDIFRVSMQPSYPDPEEYYAFFYSGTGESINLTGFFNESFDSLFEKSRVEQNSTKRLKYFHEMEKILAFELPVFITSHHSDLNFIVPNRIKGFKQKYLLPDIREIWLDELE
jgi:ABC-type transport system substrate-binding protein